MRSLLFFVFLLLIGVTNANESGKHNCNCDELKELHEENQRLRKELQEYKAGHGKGRRGHKDKKDHDEDVSLSGKSLVRVPDFGKHGDTQNCKAPEKSTEMIFSAGKTLKVTAKLSHDDDSFTVALLDKNKNAILHYRVPVGLDEHYVCTVEKNRLCTNMQTGTELDLKYKSHVTIEIKIQKYDYEIYADGVMTFKFPHCYPVKDVETMVICSWRKSGKGFLRVENVSLRKS